MAKISLSAPPECSIEKFGTHRRHCLPNDQRKSNVFCLVSYALLMSCYVRWREEKKKSEEEAKRSKLNASLLLIILQTNI